MNVVGAVIRDNKPANHIPKSISNFNNTSASRRTNNTRIRKPAMVVREPLAHVIIIFYFIDVNHTTNPFTNNERRISHVAHRSRPNGESDQ